MNEAGPTCREDCKNSAEPTVMASDKDEEESSRVDEKAGMERPEQANACKDIKKSRCKKSKTDKGKPNLEQLVTSTANSERPGIRTDEALPKCVRSNADENGPERARPMAEGMEPRHAMLWSSGKGPNSTRSSAKGKNSEQAQPKANEVLPGHP